MPQSYYYSKSLDFPSGFCDPTQLKIEIDAEAGITTALDLIFVGLPQGGAIQRGSTPASDEDRVDIVFNAALSAGELTVLDGDTANPAGGLIANHPVSTTPPNPDPPTSPGDPVRVISDGGAGVTLPALDGSNLTGVTDADAIHNNVDNEFAITEKASPVSADRVLIEDSAASFAKRYAQVGNLPSGAGGQTIYDAIVAPSGGDYTLPSAAFTAGAKSVFVRTGVYAENTNNVVIPDGGTLIGEEQGVELQFTTGQLLVDGNGGTTETAGTISVTAGSTAVTGSGTTFTNLSGGDYLFIGPDAYEISSVTDATNIVLVNPWRGPNRSGLPMFGTAAFKDVTVHRVAISGSTNANGGFFLRGVINAHVEAVRIRDCTHNWQIQASANFACEDVWSLNSTNDGLDITTSRSIMFAECHFANSGGHGMEVTAGLAFKFNDCEFSVNALNGVNVTGSATDVTFDGCGMKQNLLKGVNTDIGTIRCIIDGCTVQFNGAQGIDFDGDQNIVTSSTVGNNGTIGLQCGAEGVISGCHVHNNGGNGVDLAGDNDTLVVGCLIRLNGGDGINITQGDNADRCILANNGILSNTGAPISIGAGVDSTVIRGNTINGNGNGNAISDSGTNTTHESRNLGANGSTLNNFGATVNPTVNDDTTLGYTAGSIWVNLTANTAYVCVDNADGAAVWNQIDGSGSGDVTAAANIADNAVVRGDGGAKGVQDSQVTIDDAGKITAKLALIEPVAPGTTNHIQLDVNQDTTDPYNLGLATDPGRVYATAQDGTSRQAFAFAADGVGTDTVMGVAHSADSGTSWDPLLVVKADGKVGVGKNNPAEALDVVGNIALTGTVDGRDVATDGTKLDGVEANANNYVLPAASETVVGGAELATQAEVNAGTDATRIVTPATLFNAELPATGARRAMQWSFSTTTTDADPGSATFRLNNATQSAATFIYIDDLPDSGVDMGTVIGALKNNDRIYIQGSAKARHHLFRVTGAPTDGTGYWKIPVANEVAGTALQNNAKCGFIFFEVGAGGGGSSITVEDEGTPLTTAVTKFNFAGTGVTVTEPVADEVLVTIPGGGGSAVDTFMFRVNGKPSVQTKVDGAWIAPRACTITRVTLYRRTAGSSGSTIIDVNKNGTTIYTTQGNRPTVTQAGGNDQIDATTDMDVTAVAQNDRIEVDVDQVEAGNPQDISVVVEVTY